DTSREVHEMFKTTAIDTLKQDKKCQACWYMILSTMSGSTTIKDKRYNFYILSYNQVKPIPKLIRIARKEKI
ncbi:MAG: hypothetical protein WAJ93_03890, partial [Candidatus Nitrosopolaris sp.]